MTEEKVVQISGTARRPDGQGLTEGILAQLNNVETFWKALKVATKAFADDRSAATLLIRFAAKVWILHGGTRLGFTQTAETWIGQYEKSKGYDKTDEDDKEATPAPEPQAAEPSTAQSPRYAALRLAKNIDCDLCAGAGIISKDIVVQDGAPATTPMSLLCGCVTSHKPATDSTDGKTAPPPEGDDACEPGEGQRS